ncbi:TLDc domain-containing protein [Entamoeba marina]
MQTKDPQLEMITSNEALLKEWSNTTTIKVIFDSDYDGISNLIFNKRVMNKPNLYFINFCQYGNVFGVFFHNEITSLDFSTPEFEKSKDPHNFVISLCANGRLETPSKYDIISGKSASIQLHDQDACLYDFGYGASRIYVHKPTSKGGFCKNLSRLYTGLKDIDLIGTKFPQGFHTDRVVVVQAE